MKKIILFTLILSVLFTCILPVSAVQLPTIEPQYENSSSATVTISIDSSGNATVKVCMQGKPSLKTASVTTYLEKQVGTQWARVDIDSAGDAWRYSTTNQNFQKIYSTKLSNSGQYRAVACFTLTVTTTESFTAIATDSY